MVASFISLAGIFIGIVGAFLSKFILKKNRFSVTSRAIIGAFSSVFMSKFIGRMGIGPMDIIESNVMDYSTLFLYLSFSFISGGLGVLLLKRFTKSLGKGQ